MRMIVKLACLLAAFLPVIPSCGGAPKTGQTGDGNKVEHAGAEDSTLMEGQMSPKQQAETFLEQYLAEYENLDVAEMKAHWQAAITGTQEAYDTLSAAQLAVKKLHSDTERYQKIAALLENKETLPPLTRRSLEVAYLEFKANQLPLDLLEKMVNMSSDIQRVFNNFRGKIGKKQFSNNELLDMLATERKSRKRQEIWEALKQVGAKVGPKIVALAAVRNQAAGELGYQNYWEMNVKLQEYEPEQLMKIFEDLEALTDKPFKEMKEELDREISRKLKIRRKDMKPWHYDNPFFQSPPPAEKIDLDVYFKNRKSEDVVTIAGEFFADIGMPIDKIVKNSDLYEREGKDQHAFCIDIDRKGDVRTLLNIKPNIEWMDTMLHEQGHAVYDIFLDFELPFNLREPAHIFATEAVAMLFGALAKNATWLVEYAGADKARLEKQAEQVLEQRRREQLIFARWTMVMLYFEKALYEDPSQDLNKLWWDMVERFQMISRPEERDAPDWAAKPHFTIAPVYYHNYMLGELFAAQLRSTLRGVAGHQGPVSSLSYKGQKQFGAFFKEKIFLPSRRHPWPEFVKNATGESLNPKHFAAELEN